MVTEIFGLLNLKSAREHTAKMAAKAIYRVHHQWYEYAVEEGCMGVIEIGKRDKNYRTSSYLQIGNLTICADISLYNKKELQAKINAQTQLTDVEILMHAFEKWNYDCVNHLMGDFAFAIWDSAAKELFCARDHIGMRPFFYAPKEEGFIFSSELRMVHAVFEGQPRLNNNYLLDTLVTMISDKSETAFEKIYRLPPAHRLIYKNGNITLDEYWHPDILKQVRYANGNEYIDNFRELLINAVNVRCEGALNIASELSGGLDSTLVTCVAADFASGEKIPFTAFSNTLPDNHGTVMKDEKEFIREVLAWKNTKWCEINELKSSIPEIIDHTLQTQGCFTQQRFHMFNKGIYEAAGKKGAEILLSGFGGDEMVSARTGNAVNDLIKEKQWKVLYQALKYKTSFPVAMVKVLKSILSYQFKIKRNQRITSGIFTPDMLNRRLQRLPLLDSFISENQLKKRYFNKHERKAELFLAERQLQKIGHQHVSQRLEYSYAAAAQYGVQYRYPLLDIRLLQLCLSFPAWTKNRPGMDRYLFRQAITGLVPEEIRLRSDKSGAVIPHMFLRLQKDKELLKGYFQKWANNELLKQVFDFSAFDSWMDALLERNPDEMNYLMPGAFYNYLMIMYWFAEAENK